MVRSRNNPRNADSTLFKGLTKLLSGPVTNYRRQAPRQLRRYQLDKYKFKSASNQPFKKSASTPLSNIYQAARANVNRAERYIDFEQLEFVPEIAAVLDIYADEMTTSSPLQKILTINCPNEEIKSVLESLYYDVLNVEFNLFGWCRSMCKNGDYFMYVDIDEKLGITSFIGLPLMEVERLEGLDKTNPNYVQFQWNSAGITLENWQMAHFRILGQDKYAPYGMSILDPVRRISRQLQLQEDAMMAYRIVRSPDRKVFYVDVGGINEKDIEQHMQKIVTEMKRNQIIDPDSGRVDERYNPLSVEEDFYIPVIGTNSGTRIESLPGGHYPVRKDSDIPLLDGRVITIEQLAKEHEEGKENWVYSVQDKTNQIVPGKVTWCGKNYVCNKIHRIWLDDGSYVEMAPEHPVVLRNGSRKRADELKPYDSLMPFYHEISEKVKEKLNGYSMILNPASNKFEFVHRLVANSIGGKKIALENSKEKNCAIHHVDFNKKNNSPSNLKWMGFWEHRDFHRFNGTTAKNSLRKYLLSDKHKNNVKNRIANIDDKLHRWIYGEENISRLINFNKLPETIEKTIFRNKQRWNDKEFRKNHSGSNHWLKKKWIKFYSKYSVEDLQIFCNTRNIKQMQEFIDNSDSFLKTKTQCWKFLRFYGIQTWSQFRACYLEKPNNHKVVMVEVLGEADDVYCMTVKGPNNEDDRHNFAMCGKGTPTTPGKLSGIFVNNTGDIDDVKYLRDKMMAGLKVPHSYVIPSSDSSEDKTTLSQKDIRFARTIQRLQRSIVSELEKIGIIHLFILGYRAKDLVSFKVRLNNPSKIAELQELEHWKTKFDVAGSATEGYFSRRWVSKNVLNMTDEEFLRNTREMYFDAELATNLEKIASKADLEAQAASEGISDIGDDLETDVTDNETGKESEEDILLASPGNEPEMPPGKRHDQGFANMAALLNKNKEHLTTGAKGHAYRPVQVDHRSSGARKRHMRGQYSDEMSRNTFRNVFKGGSELRSLSKGIFEDYESNYKKTIQEQINPEEEILFDEKQLLQNNKDIKVLLESLEAKEKNGNNNNE